MGPASASKKAEGWNKTSDEDRTIIQMIKQARFEVWRQRGKKGWLTYIPGWQNGKTGSQSGKIGCLEDKTGWRNRKTHELDHLQHCNPRETSRSKDEYPADTNCCEKSANTSNSDCILQSWPDNKERQCVEKDWAFSSDKLNTIGRCQGDKGRQCVEREWSACSDNLYPDAGGEIRSAESETILGSSSDIHSISKAKEDNLTCCGSKLAEKYEQPVPYTLPVENSRLGSPKQNSAVSDQESKSTDFHHMQVKRMCHDRGPSCSLDSQTTVDCATSSHCKSPLNPSNFSPHSSRISAVRTANDLHASDYGCLVAYDPHGSLRACGPHRSVPMDKGLILAYCEDSPPVLTPVTTNCELDYSPSKQEFYGDPPTLIPMTSVDMPEAFLERIEAADMQPTLIHVVSQQPSLGTTAKTELSCIPLGQAELLGRTSPIPVAHTEPSGKTSPIPVAQTELAGKTSPIPVAQAEPSGKTSPIPVAQTELSGKTSPIPVAQTEPSGKTSPIPVAQTELSGKTSPIPVSQTGHSGKTSPIPVAQTELSAKTSPIPVAQTELSGKTSPIPVAQTELSGKTSPIPVAQTELSGKTSPIPVAQTEPSGKISPIPVAQTELAGKTSPIPVAQTEPSGKTSPISVAQTELSGKTSPIPVAQTELSGKTSNTPVAQTELSGKTISTPAAVMSIKPRGCSGSRGRKRCKTPLKSIPCDDMVTKADEPNDNSPEKRWSARKMSPVKTLLRSLIDQSTSYRAQKSSQKRRKKQEMENYNVSLAVTSGAAVASDEWVTLTNGEAMTGPGIKSYPHKNSAENKGLSLKLAFDVPSTTTGNSNGSTKSSWESCASEPGKSYTLQSSPSKFKSDIIARWGSSPYSTKEKKNYVEISTDVSGAQVIKAGAT